ncbi:MAG: CopG family transcriptional regulator [Spirochaetota bacterium]
MKKTYDKPTADEIAEMAERGEDISKYFTNKGKMKYPTQRVNVDFTVEMLSELDAVASELNISRQAVIKTYLRQAMDQHYLAKSKVS